MIGFAKMFLKCLIIFILFQEDICVGEGEGEGEGEDDDENGFKKWEKSKEKEKGKSSGKGKGRSQVFTLYVYFTSYLWIFL
jgi:hypothetical protein